ncbi:MAG: flagellar hook-basal body complex protein FliE [Candidatus Gastranaerophilales bacterium]|nr:flagellar hook-basal body complex protein FliE [Candidatus Gastranaerophilales bacterium]
MNKINKMNFFEMHGINEMPTMRLNGNISINSNDTNIKSFKDTFGEMISQMNEITNKPEQVAAAAMQGKADIHEVMSAIAQSELTVQAATTVTGKILQTYEKIMQIQI